MILTLLLSSVALQGHHSNHQHESWRDLLVRTRSIDGAENNLTHADWGRAGTTFPRFTPANYEDGVTEPAGSERPSARRISNWVCAQTESMPNDEGVTDFLWQWGQFLDHDIDETPVAVPLEPFDIHVPLGDPWFDPFRTGTQSIGLNRSYGEYEGGVRQQVNEITSYIDASNVYGSDPERARALRTLDGTGRLKTSAGDLLPYNEEGLSNAPAPTADYFLAGDVRANEQVGLTAMHTLFVREHNWWVARITEDLMPDGSGGHGGHGGGHGMGDGVRRGRTQSAPPTGDELYEMARCLVAAEMQAITYREFLPVLLGPQALTPYLGYRQDVDASIRNEFATAAYRFGHTMLSPELQRLDAFGQSVTEGPLSLSEAFFRPEVIATGGIDSLLRGLATQEAQSIDPFVIDDVRNFLFGPPGAGGFDLASLNIQRGRDHGLASYNDLREQLGLGRVTNFRQVTTDGRLRRRLNLAYEGDVDAIDLWVGGLSEDPSNGSLLGEVFTEILSTQFEALRDGDRFWYRAALPTDLVQLVEAQTLARIVRRNTDIGAEFPDDPFRMN